jgi:methylated-DNA-[protein]-cysteine S-methyltransferase
MALPPTLTPPSTIQHQDAAFLSHIINSHSTQLTPRMAVTEFQEKVYALLRQIPKGRVTTYGAIARALGTSPRAVGNALRNNRFAPEVPCHRCVGSTGFITGFDGESVEKRAFEISEDGQVRGNTRQSKPKGEKAVLYDAQKIKLLSGQKLNLKLDILRQEGVEFDKKGMLLNRKRKLWDGPWEL